MTKTKNNAKSINADGFYFPVEIVDEELNSNSEYSKRVVGIIDGEKTLLNQCSDRYELIPNSEIFPNIEEVLDNSGLKYSVEYSHINHVRFYADYVIHDKDLSYSMNGTTDKIKPKLTVQHSYNGMTDYAINFGYFRMICTNGLTIPVEEMSEYNLSIKGKHTTQVIKSFEKLNEMLHTFIENRTVIGLAITSKFESLNKEAVLNVEDRIKEVLEASKITAVENKKFDTIADITERINAEAIDTNLGYKGTVTDWLIYNGINQYLNDNKRYATAPETRRKQDSRVLEFMLETA